MEDAAWEALVETLEQIIPRLAAGIRGRRFPVYNADETCTSAALTTPSAALRRYVHSLTRWNK